MSAQQWSADEAERINLEEQCVEARRREIREGQKVWPAQVRALAGAIVTVNHEGDPEIIRGLLREADRKALEASHRKTRKAGKEVVPQGDASAEPEDPEGGAPSPTRIAPEFSEGLTRRLAAHRTVALQAVLAANVQVALATLAHTLLRRAFIDDYSPDRPAMQITATPSLHAMLSAADDLKASRAFQEVEAAKAKWRERLPEQRGEWFGWLIGLQQAELLDLLALCASLTLNALPSVGAASDTNSIAAAVGARHGGLVGTDCRRVPEPCLEGAER